MSAGEAGSGRRVPTGKPDVSVSPRGSREPLISLRPGASAVRRSERPRALRPRVLTGRGVGADFTRSEWLGSEKILPGKRPLRHNRRMNGHESDQAGLAQPDFAGWGGEHAITNYGGLGSRRDSPPSGVTRILDVNDSDQTPGDEPDEESQVRQDH